MEISDEVYRLVCDKAWQGHGRVFLDYEGQYGYKCNIQGLTLTELELIMEPTGIGKRDWDTIKEDGTFKYVIEWPNSYLFVEELRSKEIKLGVINRALNEFQRTVTLPAWRKKYANYVRGR